MTRSEADRATAQERSVVRCGHHGDVVPDFVTHYYLPDRWPFLNLSELSGNDLVEVMAELLEQRRQGRQHRVFGATYMRMRRVVEERLRGRFTEAGGRPDRSSPHYFVLGESAWFRGLAQGKREVRLPLRPLPADNTSVTYPDSFTAMEVGLEFGLPQESTPYHGRVFLLAELLGLVERYCLPAAEAEEDYHGYEYRSMQKYIEVQLWSDGPVQAYLGKA